MIRDGRLWRSLYLQEWPMTTSLEDKINREGFMEPNPITKDWFTCFWQKKRQEATFSVIAFDFGGHSYVQIHGWLVEQKLHCIATQLQNMIPLRVK